MNFLSVLDVGVDGLRQMLDGAAEVKRDPDSYRTRLAGRSIGLFFMKQSLRTWVSCDVAAIQLGMHPIAIRNDQTGMGTREAPEDVARVLGRYLDAIGLRVYDHADLEAMTRYADIPVINLLSDREHPCQAIADLMTIEEHRPLAGCRITYVGDGNNVANSLILGAVMTDALITVATPPGYEPDPHVVELASGLGSVTVTDDPVDAVAGADVVYTDVWASMGHEDEAETRNNAFSGFSVDETLFGNSASDAMFLHCLPAHRGEEVTSGVLEHDRSYVFDQAENRLHAFKAVLLHLLG